MKSEFPTTSIESFQSTGQRVFHPLYVSNARKSCEQPAMVGDLFGKSIWVRIVSRILSLRLTIRVT
jgi:hypothetical protein